MQFPIREFSPEQQALWQRVNELWALVLRKDLAALRAALHPRYAGWQIEDAFPHDRDAAIHSITGDAPDLSEYHLQPLSVEAYGATGVVHYAFSATVVPGDRIPKVVTGRWTEIYQKQDGQWLMVGVSGRPDAARPCGPSHEM